MTVSESDIPWLLHMRYEQNLHSSCLLTIASMYCMFVDTHAHAHSRNSMLFTSLIHSLYLLRMCGYLRRHKSENVFFCQCMTRWYTIHDESRVTRWTAFCYVSLTGENTEQRSKRFCIQSRMNTERSITMCWIRTNQFKRQRLLSWKRKSSKYYSQWMKVFLMNFENFLSWTSKSAANFRRNKFSNSAPNARQNTQLIDRHHCFWQLD